MRRLIPAFAGMTSEIRKWMRRTTQVLSLLLVVGGLPPSATREAWADSQISLGAANIDDAQIGNGANADKNYGAATTSYISSAYSMLIQVTGVAAALGPGATITACVCSLYVKQNTTDGYIYAYRVFKPWAEGTSNGVDVDDGSATWNDWGCDANEWGGAGCSNASDAGADNGSDESGWDRTASAMDTIYVTTVNTWSVIEIPVALAQGWYDATIGERGIIITWDGVAGNNRFVTCEGTTAGERPRFSFTYTTASGVSRTKAQLIVVE